MEVDSIGVEHLAAAASVTPGQPVRAVVGSRGVAGEDAFCMTGRCIDEALQLGCARPNSSHYLKSLCCI
jgi:hypothetical protein